MKTLLHLNYFHFTREDTYVLSKKYHCINQLIYELKASVLQKIVTVNYGKQHQEKTLTFVFVLFLGALPLTVLFHVVLVGFSYSSKASMSKMFSLGCLVL